MTAIVIVVVPTRATGLRSASAIPAPHERDEREPQRKVITTGDESVPPFWTWFIENPRDVDRVAI